MVRVMDDGTFKCWYSAEHASARCVATATSSDGLTWTKQGKILDKPSGAPLNFGEPSACKFSGANYSITNDTAEVSNIRSISEATTTDGGSTWTWRLHALKGSGGANWDSTQAFDSCVVTHDGVHYLFYAGAPIAGATEGMGAQIGVATAS
jgi:hypothetical protein